MSAGARGTPIRRSIRGDVDELDHASKRAFSPRMARWLVGLGAVSLVATLLLSVLTGDDRPPRVDATPTSFSRSAVGHQAFAAVLRALDFSVTVSRHRSAEKATRDKPLFIIEPAAGSDSESKRLHDLVMRAVQRRVPVVIVLPKWDADEQLSRDDWARQIGLRPLGDARDVLQDVDAAIADAQRGSPSGDWEGVVWRTEEAVSNIYLRGNETAWKVALKPTQGLTTSDEGPLEALLEGSAGDAFPVLIARFRAAPVWVVSDPDLLNTMGLGTADHAPILYHLLTDVLVADGVVIDEVVHGLQRAESIWSELFRFPIVLATFHLAGLLALALWASLRRFGKPAPRPPRVPTGKTTLLDNTATLLALGHHAGHGVREYFRSTLRGMARVYGLPSELSDDDRITAIADLARRRGTKNDVRALAAEAAALHDRRADERRALALARRIYTFRTEMIDGAGPSH
ncbi:MAG: hypothetical protein U1F43_36750 [Myxococcota bacterium]